MRTFTFLLALFLLATPATASAAKKDERRAKKMLADSVTRLDGLEVIVERSDLC